MDDLAKCGRVMESFHPHQFFEILSPSLNGEPHKNTTATGSTTAPSNRTPTTAVSSSCCLSSTLEFLRITTPGQNVDAHNDVRHMAPITTCSSYLPTNNANLPTILIANVRSINGKLDELYAISNVNNIDMCMTET